jgi:hypothetical protein
LHATTHAPEFAAVIDWGINAHKARGRGGEDRSAVKIIRYGQA